MSHADEFDPLDELLGKREVGPANDLLRERSLAKTLPVLRRRRWVRRASWAMAFAGCYLAGMATMGAWQRGEASRSFVERPSLPAAPKRQRAGGTRLVEQPKREMTPFERLRAAGDDAWRRQGNIEAAIRLYAQALEVATPEEMRISDTHDSWLLMALKQDHLPENEHVDDPDQS
jgi:hypothetical protein